MCDEKKIKDFYAYFDALRREFKHRKGEFDQGKYYAYDLVCKTIKTDLMEEAL